MFSKIPGQLALVFVQLSTMVCLAAPPAKQMIIARPLPPAGSSSCADGRDIDVNGRCPCPAPAKGNRWTADGAVCLHTVPMPTGGACAAGYASYTNGSQTSCVWNGPSASIAGAIVAREQRGSGGCSSGGVGDVDGYCACPAGTTIDPANSHRCVTQLERRHYGCDPAVSEPARGCPCPATFSAVEGGHCVFNSQPIAPGPGACPVGQHLVSDENAVYRLARNTYNVCVASGRVGRTTPPPGESSCADGSVIEANGYCPCPQNFRESDNEQFCENSEGCIEPQLPTRCVADVVEEGDNRGPSPHPRAPAPPPASGTPAVPADARPLH